MKLELNVSGLAAVLPHAAAKEARFYLMGVCIDVRADGRVYAAATNGATLAVYRMPVADMAQAGFLPGRYILPPDVVKPALSMHKKEYTVTLTVDTNRAGSANRPNWYRVTLGNITGETIDGVFPDYPRVMPERITHDDDARPAQFDPDQLALFAKSAKSLGVKSGNVRLWHAADTARCAVVTLDARPDFVGVIMPMRYTQDPDGRNDNRQWADVLLTDIRTS